MRKPIIAGNWKMNNTINEGLELVKGIKGVEKEADVEVVVCVPTISLQAIKQELEGTGIKVGAQNMHWKESGAYTGETSPLMLRELGVEYVVIGHSERRQYFAETDETVNLKTKAALAHGIDPIVCVGETLEEREANKAEEVVKVQVVKALEGIAKEEATKIVIAYEPVWAIGTGKTASSDDANNMIAFIRNAVKEVYDAEVSDAVRIQYGGSVKPANVSEIMAKSEIDGALVGGASLKVEDFKALVRY